MQPVLTVLKGSDARRHYKPPARSYHLFYYTGFVNTFTENGRTFYPLFKETLRVTSDWNTTSGHRPIYTPRRFHILMRRTTISHFSFLISHSSEAFKRNQGAIRPTG